MSQYEPVDLLAKPANPLKATSEAKYWAKFGVVAVHKQPGAVTSVQYAPTGDVYAVTASTRVLLYDARSHELLHGISRFKDVAYSASFRHDAQLLVAGGAHPLVQVFHVERRTLLRQMRGHTGAVRVTRFGVHAGSGQVVSMSDDRSVRLWDVGTEQCVTTVAAAHSDYIRAGCSAGDGGELWVSGGYDRVAKLWDLRADAPCVASYDHGSPVECVLALPGGALVATAGGNSIKVWDTLTGRAIAVMANHQKTVTGLCLDGTQTRLLSCGLDCMIKVYDLQTYSVTHSMRATTPLMSLASAPDSASLACGGADGSVAVRQRPVRVGEQARAARRRAALDAAGGQYRYFLRGQGETASADDLVVEAQRKLRLAPYDKYLRKFQYRNAVSAAMGSREPIVVVSLLVELAHRQAVSAALSGMDADALVPMLKFVRRNCTHPHYAGVLINVANLLLDLYGGVIAHSEEVLRNVQRLRKVLQAELAFQKELFAMQGALDMLLASNSTVTAESFAPAE